MKQELENLGIELAKLARKYEKRYVTISYVDGSVQGNENPREQGYTSIFIDEEEVERRCLEEKTKNYKH